MLEFQQKRQVKKWLYSRTTLVLLLIILALVGRGVWGVYQKSQLTKENMTKTAAELQDLRDRESKLSSEINWLQTQAGTEQEIREKYGLVKPGEEVLVIVDKEATTFDLNPDEEKSFWQKIMDMVR